MFTCIWIYVWIHLIWGGFHPAVLAGLYPHLFPRPPKLHCDETHQNQYMFSLAHMGSTVPAHPAATLGLPTEMTPLERLLFSMRLVHTGLPVSICVPTEDLITQDLRSTSI